ncbi:OsmC family protein [Legionella shakespearei]|uniref:OsmC-like protein (Osmotically inducible protein C) n=1 Tax=Legionella shakespearei DSM 23087 TaxID=1122169 RepID=A0A0W0YZR6_9GAMM|nr:OsmC family protein [Legionella shakespearei]KTD62373.1 OsmC-like protein (Osmotically inducible protein C) [Legionella shakespearei DSM 23087]
MNIHVKRIYSGYLIDSYIDKAIGITNKNEHGKISVTEITLHPKIKFGGAKLPDDNALNKMREKAHEYCFISNSINSNVNIEITIS